MIKTDNLVTHFSQDRIGYITLNRPDKKNALNGEMVAALYASFKWAEENHDVKVIVLKAEGDVFCAGADLGYLQELQSNSYQENLDDSNSLKNLFLKIYTLDKVVIAQVQGHAIAGGSGLATVCDFAFAVPEAKFGYTEVKIGFIPAIVMVFLLRKVGEAVAKLLLLSGKLITANQAADMKLINEVVPAFELDGYIQSFAKKLIVNNSAQSITATKGMIGAIQEMGLHEALNHAVEMNAKTRSSEDCQKGIASFLNKKKLTW